MTYTMKSVTTKHIWTKQPNRESIIHTIVYSIHNPFSCQKTPGKSLVCVCYTCKLFPKEDVKRPYKNNFLKEFSVPYSLITVF